MSENIHIDSTEQLKDIRIARISTVPFFVVAQLKSQIELLGKSGAKVTVVASDEPEFQLLNGLIGVSCLPINIVRSISPWNDLLALIRLFLFFKHEKIQIAHSTTPKAGLLTAIAAFFAGVPIRLHTFTGQPWVCMSGFTRIIARLSDSLIGVLNTHCYTDSPSQKDFLVAEEIINHQKLSVIGSGSLAGVNLSRFNKTRFSEHFCEDIRRSLGIPDSAQVLLYLGRVTVDKGVRELLNAYEILKASYPDVHLILVGRFDSESGVQGSILQTDVESIHNVHIVGHTEVPEQYIAISDVLCLPSYREGFGTVVIEAAAMEVPTIGTKIYGLKDAIVDQETGLLVDVKSVDGLVNALKGLLNDHTLRRQMGDAAKRRAQELFASDYVNQLLIDEYRIFLKEKQLIK